MKKIILIVFGVALLLSFKVEAQITFEHAYPPGAALHLYIVNLEVAGQKYCWRDWAGSRVVLYNLDHSLFKSMALPTVSYQTNYQRSILYVSQNLFDCTEDYIEYIYHYVHAPSYQNSIVIVNEFGTIIFNGDSLAPMVQLNMPQTQQPIYNTPLGTKMILSGIRDSVIGAFVYDLCGTLSTSSEPIGLSPEDISALSAYPNPSSNQTTISYQFPPDINEGEIILYDMSGAEAKRYRVDSMFSNILLDNSALKSGTYFYQFTASGNIIGTKKMVVVK
jgi:hypothetical protein